jgi:hypothetical protein
MSRPREDEAPVPQNGDRHYTDPLRQPVGLCGRAKSSCSRRATEASTTGATGANVTAPQRLVPECHMCHSSQNRNLAVVPRKDQAPRNQGLPVFVRYHDIQRPRGGCAGGDGGWRESKPHRGGGRSRVCV